MSPYESLDPYKTPEEDPSAPLRVDPDVEQSIEGDPVSNKVKVGRLAGAMVDAWRRKNNGEMPEVEVVNEDDEQKAA